jgi:hypothetical protein
MALHFACDAQACALAWAGLAQHLPPPQRDRALAHALQIARTIPLDLDRVEALGKLVPKLGGRQRVEAVREAYSIALKLPTGNNRTHALTRLIPLLPEAWRNAAIAAALNSGRLVEDEYGRFLAIVRLARQLQDADNKMQIFLDALASTYSIAYIYHRASALVEILPELPTIQREPVFDQLLEFLGMPLEVGLKADILTILAPHVPEHRQNLIIAIIIDAIKALLPITFGFGMFSITRLLPLVRKANGVNF